MTPGDTPAARAARAATATIPIVFSVAGDPVELGLVASLSQPGGNATGFAELNTQVISKRMGLLHELVPTASSFGLLIDRNTPLSQSSLMEIQRIASGEGWRLHPITIVPTVQQLEAVFPQLGEAHVQALLIVPGAPFSNLVEDIARLTAEHGVPAMYWTRKHIDAGGLISYGSDIRDQFWQVGIYAGRILKGEKPQNLPVQQATKFELFINAKAVKALGLSIPPTLLSLADEVIE